MAARWDVKLGPEAQSEVVTSRVLWALGYHQPATYYIANWQLAGGPGGAQQGARFRLEAEGRRSHRATGHGRRTTSSARSRISGLIVANILLNSWDWKTTNNKIYRFKSGAPPQRYVVRDLGASLGKTSPSRLLWILPVPVRGFGQGTRNNIDDFESQGFIKRVDENRVEFDFHTIYGSVVELVRPSDVRWTAELLQRISDEQWDAAFRAADYSPDVRARFIKKDQSEDC